MPRVLVVEQVSLGKWNENRVQVSLCEWNESTGELR